MAVTQIHTPELYQDIVFNAHVNPQADIQGTKIREGTILERGTVKFATNLGTDPLTAVQANDTRMHLANQDTGTIANTFTINTDHIPGDNSTLYLASSEALKGGAFRYNDNGSYLEFTNNYNGARQWHRLIGMDELGNGIIYRTIKRGNQADNTPTNTMYTLSSGSFTMDGIKLLVFVNGQFKSHFSGDYTIYDTNTICFNSSRSNEDTIEIIVYQDIISRTAKLGSQADNPARTQFSITSGSLVEDINSVMVYVNGQLKCESTPYGFTKDYSTLNSTTIEFTSSRNTTDIIEIIITAIGNVVTSTTTSDGTNAETFRIANTSNDLLGNYKLMFGSGTTLNCGLRNFWGQMQFTKNGQWCPMTTGMEPESNYNITGEFSFNNFIVVPRVSTRPSGSSGMIQLNTASGQFEGYNGTTWKEFSGNNSGSSSTTVEIDYTIIEDMMIHPFLMD